MSSFISEHSLEYILAPRLQDILLKKFYRVIPLYFWASREGNSLSKDIHKDMMFRIICVFPRRIKIDGFQKKKVYFKINDEIIEFAERINNNGIQTILGFPEVFNFLDISPATDITWAKIIDYNKEEQYLRVGEDKYLNLEFSEKPNLKIINESEIIETAIELRTLSLPDIIDIIKMSKRVGRMIPFWGGLHYKPFYVLLVEKSSLLATHLSP